MEDAVWVKDERGGNWGEIGVIALHVPDCGLMLHVTSQCYEIHTRAQADIIPHYCRKLVH